MLRTLQNLEATEASRVLTAAASIFLPSPIERSGTITDPLVIAIVNEVRSQLKIDLSDNSEVAQGRILAILSTELSRILLPPAAERGARLRLGEYGRLRLSDYQISIDPSFEESRPEVGVRESHIVDAIRFPTMFEHLTFGPADDGFGISLFIKKISDARAPFSLLVHAIRKADTLSVIGAWRAYDEQVPGINSSGSVIEQFRRFEIAYGLPYVLAGRALRFVEYDVLPREAGVNINNLRYGVIRDATRRSIFVGVIRLSTLNVIQVAVAYTVDIDRLARDVERQGHRR